jgi:hypothetical protein
MLFVEWHPLQSYKTAQKPPCKHASAWVAAFLVVVSKITQALASDLPKLRYAILSWTLCFSHGLVWAAQALAAAVSEHCWLLSTRVVTGEKATTKVLCIYFDLYPGAICITCARDATCPTHASGISLRVYLNLISWVFRLCPVAINWSWFQGFREMWPVYLVLIPHVWSAQRAVFSLHTFVKNGLPKQNLLSNPGSGPMGVVSVASNLSRPVPKLTLLLHRAHCQNGAKRTNTKILNLRNDKRFWVCVSGHHQ